MRDAHHYTVLSYACYKNSEASFFILYDFVNDNLPEDKHELLMEWVDTPTDEDLTALLFSV